MSAADDSAQLAELAQPFARRLAALLAQTQGVTITSGYRSRARQQQLYDLWKAGRGNPANRPGTSRHETGEAADLAFPNAAARDRVHQLARSHGLRFPYAHEPWHVEPDGTPDPPSDPDDEDDTVSPETLQQLRTMVREEVQRVAVLLIRGDDPDPKTGDTHPDNLQQIRRDVRALRDRLDGLKG